MRRRIDRLAMVLASLSFMTVACSGSSAPLAIVANAHQAGTLAVGEQRVLIGLVEQDTNRFLGGEDIAVEIDYFFGDDPNDVAGTVAGEFLWTVPEVRGLYTAAMTFDRAGTWGLVARLDGETSSDVTLFSVAPQSPVPEVGEVAPLAETPTAATAALEDITTDPEPDPRFYAMSLDDALTSGRPTVVVFATPAFCPTATCGPTLDIVKSVAPGHPDVDFVHVEVYTNLEAQTPEELEVVPAVRAWALPSEPWVFVVGADGRIVGVFEGSLSPVELEAALARAR